MTNRFVELENKMAEVLVDMGIEAVGSDSDQDLRSYFSESCFDLGDRVYELAVKVLERRQ